MSKKHKGDKEDKTFDWQKEADGYFGWTPKPKTWFEVLGWLTALST